MIFFFFPRCMYVRDMMPVLFGEAEGFCSVVLMA